MASLSEESFCFPPKRIKLDFTPPDPPINPERDLFRTETHNVPVDPPPQGNDEPLVSETHKPPADPIKESELFSPETSPLSKYLGMNDHEDIKDDDDEQIDTLDEDEGDSNFSSPVGSPCKFSHPYVSTMCWLEKQMLRGASPREIFAQLTGNSILLPDTLHDLSIWELIFSLLDELPKRTCLSTCKMMKDVVHLLRTCNKIVVLTGAGVSVSCGIPDFRSRNGVYARLAVDFPDLPDPQSMFDINYFLKDPRPFFKFAKEIYPGQFKPSPSHRFIKMLEKKKKLLRNYTQNIDTLEREAGIENVVECHGSFSTATCTKCSHKVSCEQIREDVFQQKIPICSVCLSNGLPETDCGVMKPDIVFFGEGLPDTFHDSMKKDKDECDLLIVIGSSLKVRPVALIPNILPGHVPQILINRERLSNMKFDVELLGDSDVIIDQLCHMLGEDWDEGRSSDTPLTFLKSPQFEVKKHYDTDSIGSCGSLSEEGGEGLNSVRCQKIGRRVGSDEETGRHASLDSSRDSGIGEGSNSSSASSSTSSSIFVKEKCCQPIDNAYFKMKKRVYVFPGAEIPQKLSFSFEEGQRGGEDLPLREEQQCLRFNLNR